MDTSWSFKRTVRTAYRGRNRYSNGRKIQTWHAGTRNRSITSRITGICSVTRCYKWHGYSDTRAPHKLLRSFSVYSHWHVTASRTRPRLHARLCTIIIARAAARRKRKSLSKIIVQRRYYAITLRYNFQCSYNFY